MGFRGISAAEWRRVNEVADLLLDTAPEHWDEVAGKEFDTEEVLRQAAIELARSFDDSTGLLGARPLDKVGPPGGQTAWNAGERIGAYRIEREIGRGGMGCVYEASRADGAFSKKVAIKSLRGAGISALERFRAERRILAGLEHENIARLHDAGEAPDGSLYFVMEYVEGKTLDVYCRNLGRRPLLQLFHTVAAAVACAHAQDIVHRDLKPGNILVNAAGVPKLLDFGVASAQSVAGSSAAYGFTPAWASPEQTGGGEVTERSDVYALGMILLSLLEPQGIENIPKDLAAILKKAMAESPGDRYPTAAELALDLKRHLDGFPVLARPLSPGYRLLYLVRRKRVAAMLAAGILLASAIGLAGVLLQRQRAETQLRSAADFVREVLAEETNMRGLAGTTEVRHSLVEKALDHLRSISPEDARDPGLACDLADAWVRLGLVLGIPGGPSLGDFAGAETSIRRGRLLAEEIVRRWPRFIRGRQLLASSLAYEESLLGWRGDSEGCIRRGLRSREEFRRLAELAPDSGSALLTNEEMLVRCYTKLGRLDEAIGAARQWVSDEERRPSTPDAVPTAYGRLARTLWAAGDLDEGRAAFRHTVDLRRQALRESPSYFHRVWLAQEIVSAASARPEPCRDPDDRAELRQAAAMGAEGYAADAKDATALALFSDARRCLAMNLAANGSAGDALILLEKDRRVLMAADPASSPVRKRLAQTWLETASTDQRMSDREGAERALEAGRAALLQGAAEPADALSMRDYWSLLGDIREHQGRAGDAIACWRRQVQTMEEYVRAVPGRDTTLELARTLHDVGLRLLTPARPEGLGLLDRSVAAFAGVPFPLAAETAQARLDLERARLDPAWAGPATGMSHAR